MYGDSVSSFPGRRGRGNRQPIINEAIDTASDQGTELCTKEASPPTVASAPVIALLSSLHAERQRHAGSQRCRPCAAPGQQPGSPHRAEDKQYCPVSSKSATKKYGARAGGRAPNRSVTYLQCSLINGLRCCKVALVSAQSQSEQNYVRASAKRLRRSRSGVRTTINVTIRCVHGIPQD